MAGFMKNAMSYLGMSDVVDDDDEYFDEEDEQQPAAKPSFDSDHTVTPIAQSTASPSAKTSPFQGGRVNRITTIHPKSMRMRSWWVVRCVMVCQSSLTSLEFPKPWPTVSSTFPQVWYLACEARSNV